MKSIHILPILVLSLGVLPTVRAVVLIQSELDSPLRRKQVLSDRHRGVIGRCQ